MTQFNVKLAQFLKRYKVIYYKYLISKKEIKKEDIGAKAKGQVVDNFKDREGIFS